MQSIILTTAVLLFPFWGPLWEKGPLTSGQLEQPPVYHMDEALYPLLKQQLSNGNLASRRSIYSALAEAPIPANRDFLLNHCLKTEKSSELRASILRFMHRMEPEKVPLQLLEKLLKDDAPSVVFEAMRLYCLHPDARPSLLMPFLGAPDKRHADALLERSAWNAFAWNGAFANALGNRVFDFRSSPSPEVRLYAFRAALAQGTRSTQLREWMEEALSGSDEMRLALAQDRHPENSRMAMKLKKDRKSVLRQAVCEAEASSRFPEVLLLALKDKVPSVRIAALKSLAKAENVPEGGASKVFALLEDRSFIVRAEAEDTLVAMTAKCDVAGTLDDGLSSTADKLLRYHSLNVARRIGAKSFARRIATELTRDESPELAAASLDALSCLAGKGEYAQIIIPFADSKSPLVRQMAARAMGRLQLPGSEDALIRLVAKGNPANVRKEAYEAMGRYPQQVFVPRLVACLKAVKSTGSDERAVAAWSLGQMRGGDVRQLIAAAQRLQVQCTKAVIPDVMPMFDDVTVIANAFWTLAVLAKRTGNPEIRKCYDAVVKAYDVKVEELEKQDGDGTELPLSEMTCCMIRQVRQYFEGREYTTMPVPTQELKLPVKQIK